MKYCILLFYLSYTKYIYGPSKDKFLTPPLPLAHSQSRQFLLGERLSFLPQIQILCITFCILFYVPQITIYHVYSFSILNFGYFIRNVKQIHGKLWLMEHKMEHKKWYRGFIFYSHFPHLSLPLPHCLSSSTPKFEHHSLWS